MIVDLSDYSAIPDATQVQCLKTLVSRAIVGASYGTVWKAQIDVLEQGGIPVEAYLFPDSMVQLDGRGWWLDCETASATKDSVRAICKCGGPRPYATPIGIYSRKSWWDANMGDWNIKAEFPDLMLWDARYVHGGNDPCLGWEVEQHMIPLFIPYGGFEQADLVQWHDSIDICGINVDLSREESMTDADFKRFTDYVDIKLIQMIAWINAQKFSKAQ